MVTASSGAAVRVVGVAPHSARDGAARPACAFSILPAGAKSALVDVLDDAPPPLPTNAESALLCVCGSGILAIASERAAAFTPKQQAYLERCCELIDGP